jgi:hypothetical protein
MPGLVSVGFVVDRVALGQVLLRVLRFSRQYHSTVALLTHISSGGWTKGPLVAVIQTHSLIPSTWTAADWLLKVQSLFSTWWYTKLATKFRTFYGTWRFITVFTRVHHQSLSWAIWNQSTPQNPTILWPILIQEKPEVVQPNQKTEFSCRRTQNVCLCVRQHWHCAAFMRLRCELGVQVELRYLKCEH